MQIGARLPERKYAKGEEMFAARDASPSTGRKAPQGLLRQQPGLPIARLQPCGHPELHSHCKMMDSSP
jgi:hypothetical protein